MNTREEGKEGGSLVTLPGFFLFPSSLTHFLVLFQHSKRFDRPLPSSKNPHFQNEAKCTSCLVKMSFICTRMENHLHIKGWALGLVLIQRLGGTRKWPIVDCKTVRIFAYSSRREQWNKRSGTRLKTKSETGEFFSLASHALQACEARALRARKTFTPRFTDFFTDFEKKTDCFAV